MVNQLKRIISLCCFCLLLAQSALAGLSSGEFAPTFTLDDINGQRYDLESLASEGKTVILHFGTTWCSTCWNLNQSQLLSNIYKKYGSKGSDELVILYLESDLNTNLDCLKGKKDCGSDTYGDWTRDVKFPIVDLDASSAKILEDYQVDYYPMVYIITPNRKAFEIDITEEFDIEKYFKESVQLNIEAMVETDDCTGLSDISMSVDGGNGRLFFEWSDGSKDSYLEDIKFGQYSVTVTDENGVQQETELDILPTKNQIVINSESVSSVSYWNGEDGAIDLSVSGGVGELSYYWEHGDQGPSLMGLPAGTYKVAIIDQGGCEINKRYMVETTVALSTKDEISKTEKHVEQALEEVEEIFEEVELSIFPNPVAKTLHFEASQGPNEVVILDNQGRQLTSIGASFLSKNQIDVSDYPSGIYKIQFVFSERTLTKAFIKAR